MADQVLTRDTEAQLSAELERMGVDVRRLEFLRWLVVSGRDPEWSGRRLTRDDKCTPKLGRPHANEEVRDIGTKQSS